MKGFLIKMELSHLAATRRRSKRHCQEGNKTSKEWLFKDDNERVSEWFSLSKNWSFKNDCFISKWQRRIPQGKQAPLERWPMDSFQMSSQDLMVGSMLLDESLRKVSCLFALQWPLVCPPAVSSVKDLSQRGISKEDTRIYVQSNPEIVTEKWPLKREILREIQVSKRGVHERIKHPNDETSNEKESKVNRRDGREVFIHVLEILHSSWQQSVIPKGNKEFLNKMAVKDQDKEVFKKVKEGRKKRKKYVILDPLLHFQELFLLSHQ